MRALDFGHLIELLEILLFEPRLMITPRSVANDKRSRDAELMIRMSGMPRT